MFNNLSGGTSEPEKNRVGTEFSACKSKMDRMNTPFMQSLSLTITKQQFLMKCLCFGCTPMRKGL